MAPMNLDGKDLVWEHFTLEPIAERRHVVAAGTLDYEIGSVGSGQTVIASHAAGIRNVKASRRPRSTQSIARSLTQSLEVAGVDVISVLAVWLNRDGIRLAIDVANPSAATWAHHAKMIAGSGRSVRQLISRAAVRLVGPFALAHGVVVIGVKR